MQQVFWTVFAGVLVFVVGQIIIKFVIEPIHEFRKFTGEIADALIFYCNVYSNPGLAREEELNEAQRTFRQQAAKLLSKAHTVSGYNLWAWCRLLPMRKDLQEAASYLIGISNGVFDKSQSASENNDKRRRVIESRLGLLTGE
jgi:hypothetical protein